VPLLKDGDVSGFLVLYQDVTERRKAEQQLREQSTYLHTLIEANPIAIVAENPQSQIELSNRAFRDLFGYGHDEMIAKSIDDLIAPEHLQDEATSFSRQVRLGESCNAIVQRRHKDGHLIDVEAFGVPFLVDGVLRGQFGLYSDISKRVEAEKALKESEELFRTLSSAAADWNFHGRWPWKLPVRERTMDRNDRDVCCRSHGPRLVGSDASPGSRQSVRRMDSCNAVTTPF
jgi:PAS domain S-box-containing protein